MNWLTHPARFLFFIGKGGVGKTTVAAALALGLVQKDRTVHLSTTDPAAHVSTTLGEQVPGLHLSRIDPSWKPGSTSTKSWLRGGRGWTRTKRPCCWRTCVLAHHFGDVAGRHAGVPGGRLARGFAASADRALCLGDESVCAGRPAQRSIAAHPSGG